MIGYKIKLTLGHNKINTNNPKRTWYGSKKNYLKLTDEHRAKIKTSMLLKRLENNALGLLKKPLSSDEIRSIDILLKKSMPDMQRITHEGSNEQPMKIDFSWQPPKNNYRLRTKKITIRNT